MKTILTILAAALLAAGQAFAHCGTCGSDSPHKGACVKGEPCKCADCGQACGSEACKAGKACKGDGC